MLVKNTISGPKIRKTTDVVANTYQGGKIPPLSSQTHTRGQKSAPVVSNTHQGGKNPPLSSQTHTRGGFSGKNPPFFQGGFSGKNRPFFRGGSSRQGRPSQPAKAASQPRVQPRVPQRSPANRRDRGAVAQWSGPRICNPKASRVDPGNGQKWDERLRERSIWPDPARKRNSRTSRGHPDGFRAVKRPFRVGFSDFPPGAKRLKPAGG